MTLQLIALGVLALAFFVASVRSVHMGALTLAAALGVGLAAGQPVKEILGGFPVSVVLLLLGVTYLFGIARSNGTLDVIVDVVVRRAGTRGALLPWVFFALSAGVGSLGSPLAAVVIAPIALSFARRAGRDPSAIGIAVITGASTGGFAPTSLFGILTVGIAERGGIDVNPMLLFGYVFAVNAVLLLVATLVFRRPGRPVEDADDTGGAGGSGGSGGSGGEGSDGDAAGGPADAAPLSGTGGTAIAVRPAPAPAPALTGAGGSSNDGRAFRIATLLAIAALVVAVVGLTLADVNADAGTIALGLGVLLSLAFPGPTATAVRQIDWSTILLVSGVLTYIGVLERLGALDLLGDLAKSLQSPLLAAFVLCLTGALVSAFASTTGILGILIPLALPLVAAGSIPGAGLVMAVAVCSSLVDTTPFSTAGAAVVASGPDEGERRRMSRDLTRWGLSLIIGGPIITCATLIVPSLLG
ncbi:SLC13 family permease [Streptomyces sp. NBC_01298]|uniref:SLC13 family permease n=1 Tax=Streptomyces sp. NBC_01298 TaxID=2903817 RepID=UPI002E0D4A9E|nr:SLC13 family permease [Streptomyces sp. NBC_01298]